MYNNLTEKEIRSISQYLKKHLGKDEEVTPEKVVELAKDSDSPIHSYFEWDDKKAAKSYRMIQASQLIKVVVINASRREPSYQYLKLTPDYSDNYFEHKEDVKDSLFDQMIPSALNELKQFKARYKSIPAFEPVLYAIDVVERKYQNVSIEEEAS